jgi:hypothetical protein
MRVMHLQSNRVVFHDWIDGQGNELCPFRLQWAFANQTLPFLALSAQQRGSTGGKGRLTAFSSPVNRRVAGSNPA